jgi:predicted nuclease of predicted toxin-antitoxin system
MIEQWVSRVLSLLGVTTSQEARLIEARDEQQAAYGRDQARVVFTHDADFLRLQATGVPHAGIICAMSPFSRSRRR